MTEPSAVFVGDIPEHYDAGLGPHIFQDYATDLAKRAAALAPSQVLELAAGTGISSRALRDALPPSASLIITDLNEPMLDIARRKFSASEAVDFKVADAMDLPFADGGFDLVVSQFGVMFFPDKRIAFREALRTLMPGGRFLFNVWTTMQANPFAQLAFGVGAHFFPDNPPTFYMVPFGYHDRAIVEGDLSAAGFTGITCDVVRINKEIRDWSLFARGLIYGNPIILEIGKDPGVEPADVVSALERVLRDRFGEEPASMPLEAMVFTAMRG